MVNVNELRRGDIVIIKHNGQPYHIAIYSPKPDLIGDLIHMGSGFKRSGAIRGTLAKLCQLHHDLNQA